MKRVVIVGAGFGGLAAARHLARHDVEVLLLDRQNYHLFQPLLYQVATAGLEGEAIVYPIRGIVRRWPHAHFRMAEVLGVDFAARTLHTTSGPYTYDYLILSAGAATNFSGLESVRQQGFELKALDDALALRSRILTRFERAVGERNPARRAALLSFVVVGGGPTGIEFAGALGELVSQVLRKDFPELEDTPVRVVLVEAADRLLGQFPEKLGRYAHKRLESLGVEVRLGLSVTEAAAGLVHFNDGSSIPSDTLLWSAGVKAAPLADTLPVDKAGGGRIAVQPDLTLPAYPEVYVIGDMAHLEQDGKPLPQTAPVAIQQGRHAARSIISREQGKPVEPFRFRDKGSMAVIGRGSAVARLPWARFSGLAAWLIWLVLHLYYLVDFRNRLIVMLNWAYQYFRFDRKVRLIIQETESGALPAVQPVSAGMAEAVPDHHSAGSVATP
jgi:NADH dehydrogenase